MLYLPEVAGAVITAVVLGLVITKRAMHYLPLVGMVFLAAGILVFAVNVPPSQAATLHWLRPDRHRARRHGRAGVVRGGLLVASANLQRVFAIVELLRAVAAFMVAPIFVYFAATVGSSLEVGTQIALWIGFGLAVVGALVGVALYALGGARPQTPDLPRFLEGKRPAWYSPPLLARVRRAMTTARSRDGKRRLNGLLRPRRLGPRAGALRLRRIRTGSARDRAGRPANSHPAATLSSSVSGNRQTSDSSPSASSISTPRTRPK